MILHHVLLQALIGGGGPQASNGWAEMDMAG
jgi:hypothetical protein